MALCLGVVVQVAWVCPSAAAASGDRIVVERSVDPAGFLLNRADSACLIVPPNGMVAHQYANGARFDGLQAC
jgi:hypothetical protein